ncbi:hypothetical protein ACWC2K_38470 [Streptomyces chattanoogensis]|uniref:hypothetical protein n=1 Tax=Streptomyces chattanoogensis TaxID=66876 RepID=UPI00367D9B27
MSSHNPASRARAGSGVVRRRVRTRPVRRNGSPIGPARPGHGPVRVWCGPEGEVLLKGTAATAGLWPASVGVHIGLGQWLDPGAGVPGTASLYAHPAIGLGTQNLLVRGRAAAA